MAKILQHVALEFALLLVSLACANALGSENLALLRPTLNKSHHGELTSDHAVDGSDAHYMSASDDDSPWWAVSLAGPHWVSVVVVTNAAVNGTSTRNFEVRVGDSPDVMSNAVCSGYSGAMSAGEMEVFICSQPLLGNYVSINQYSAGMRLGEVEAYGTPAVLVQDSNLALHKPTLASGFTISHIPDKAVDGTPAYFSSDSNVNTPWWRVDLEAPYTIQFVVITNTDDRSGHTRNFQVRVGNNQQVQHNPVCYHYKGVLSAAEKVFLPCNGKYSGRYVFVNQFSDSMQLAEVEVYGY